MTEGFQSKELSLLFINKLGHLIGLIVPWGERDVFFHDLILLIETVTNFSLDQELMSLSGHRIAALTNFVSFSTFHIFHLDPRTFFPAEAEVIDCFNLGKLWFFIFLLVRDVVIEGAHGRQISAMFNIRGQD